jgi:chaperonin GroEL
MVGGVAIINVGGGTEIEMKEKKDRLDDALQATKAALEEGILPGAGVALLHARNAINLDGKDDKAKGAQIVYNACSTPSKQILANAGEDNNQWWLKLYNQEPSMVPDLTNNTTVNAYDSGIIDPTKVVRCALQNAAAAAVTLLMTECVIFEKPSDKKNDDMNGMAGLGM